AFAWTAHRIAQFKEERLGPNLTVPARGHSPVDAEVRDRLCQRPAARQAPLPRYLACERGVLQDQRSINILLTSSGSRWGNILLHKRHIRASAAQRVDSALPSEAAALDGDLLNQGTVL